MSPAGRARRPSHSTSRSAGALVGTRRTLWAALATIVVLAAWVAGAGAVAAAAAWSPPWRYAGPFALDLLAPQLVLSSAGESAVTFAAQNADQPSASQALIAFRSPGGLLTGARRLPGAQELLDAAYVGDKLALLAGDTRGGICCATDSVTEFGPGASGRPQTLVAGHAGPTLGSLVALGASRLLAAVANRSGVWVAETGAGGRFGTAVRLTSSSPQVQTLVGARAPGGKAAIAWTQSGWQGGPLAARTIFLATVGGRGPGRSATAAVTVARTHGIEELDLAAGSGRPTAAWVEDWFGNAGRYHSQVAAADVGGRGRAMVRSFSILHQVAGGISLAADSSGDQVLSWRSCDSVGDCFVQAVTRRSRGRWTVPLNLGPVDASQDPVAAVGARGAAVVAWVDGGSVVEVDRPSARAVFSAVQTVSGTMFASDLTAAVGPGNHAYLAWTQGTFAPSIMGSVKVL